MKPISIGESFEFFMGTLNHCGEFLLSLSDEKIGHYIFEAFNGDVITFLHHNTLDKLEEAGFIDRIMYNHSKELRKKFMALQDTSLWNIESVKTAPEWRKIMRLSDEIRASIKEIWSDEELKRLYDKDRQIRIECPCCGYFTHVVHPNAVISSEISEICKICAWKYNAEAQNQPETVMGDNHITLNEARANYKKFGVCEERFIGQGFTRLPMPVDLPENNLRVKKVMVENTCKLVFIPNELYKQ